MRVKRYLDPVRINKGIINITGATMSVRSIRAGVKRVLVLIDEFYLKPAGLGSDTVAARKSEKGFFTPFSETRASGPSASPQCATLIRRFRLRDSDRHIRLLYTFFLLLMLAGFAFSFFWAHSMTGLSPQGIASHYRGSDATFGEPMSFRELAEITHFHLFTMPVVFMILVHVLYLTSAGSMLKIITTWMSFGGVMLDLVSPWLISYVSPLFVLTMLTGDILMTVGFLIMMTIPLYEMWFLNQPLMAGKHETEE